MFLLDHDSLFKPSHCPNTEVKPRDILFYYQDNRIAVVDKKLPRASFDEIKQENNYCFGTIEDRQCILWHNPIAGMQLVDTRYSHEILEPYYYQAVAFGNHIHHFRLTHHYCGQCGAAVKDVEKEQALICTRCSHIIYPRISPCVIVLIRRGDKILLARSPYFKPKVMSTLAGFIGIGETAEQTIIREVKEEVDIEVANIRYVASQAWPFPNSLMLGFKAEWKSGEIKIDSEEIEEAGWFTKTNLPLLPNKMSIARYLIDHYINSN